MELSEDTGQGQGKQHSSNINVTSFSNPTTNTSLPCSSALATPEGHPPEVVTAGALLGNRDHDLGHLTASPEQSVARDSPADVTAGDFLTLAAPGMMDQELGYPKLGPEQLVAQSSSPGMPHNTMGSTSPREALDVPLGTQKMSPDGEVDAAGENPGTPRGTAQLLDELEHLLVPMGASTTPCMLLQMTAAEAPEYAVTILGLDAECWGCSGVPQLSGG
jgi:hypothetical protein